MLWVGDGGFGPPQEDALLQGKVSTASTCPLHCLGSQCRPPVGGRVSGRIWQRRIPRAGRVFTAGLQTSEEKKNPGASHSAGTKAVKIVSWGGGL